MNLAFSYYHLIFVVSVTISSISQVMLKKSANKKENTGLKEYLNPLVIIAYGLFFISTVLTMYAFKGVPMNQGPVIESLGYVIVMILGRIFLSEKITRNKLIGICLILAGVLLWRWRF